MHSISNSGISGTDLLGTYNVANNNANNPSKMIYIMFNTFTGFHRVFTKRLDARHCLLFRVSFGLKPDSAEAGQDAGLGGTPPLSRHLVDARRRHLRHRPWPLVRPGAVPLAPGRAGLGGPGRHLRHLPWPPVLLGAVLTVLSLSWPASGAAQCPLANGRGCLVGCPSARRIAGTHRH